MRIVARGCGGPNVPVGRAASGWEQHGKADTIQGRRDVTIFPNVIALAQPGDCVGATSQFPLRETIFSLSVRLPDMVRLFDFLTGLRTARLVPLVAVLEVKKEIPI